jgi:hypothetical protein
MKLGVTSSFFVFKYASGEDVGNLKTSEFAQRACLFLP